MRPDQGTDNRWQGYSHQELYDSLHAGPGGSAAGAVADNWSGLAEALTGIQQDIDHGVSASGATWTGAAADSARAGLAPLADWAGQASAAADTMRLSTELQGSLLGQARTEMPPPMPVRAEVPSTALGIGQLIRAQVDYEVREAMSNAAEQRAFQVMANYEAGTSDNTGTLGDFGQPPPLVVDTAPIVAQSGPVTRSSGSIVDRAPAPSAAPVITESAPPRVPVVPVEPSASPSAPIEIVVEANFPVTVEVSGNQDPTAPVVIVEDHSPG